MRRLLRVALKCQTPQAVEYLGHAAPRSCRTGSQQLVEVSRLEFQWLQSPLVPKGNPCTRSFSGVYMSTQIRKMLLPTPLADQTQHSPEMHYQLPAGGRQRHRSRLRSVSQAAQAHSVPFGARAGTRRASEARVTMPAPTRPCCFGSGTSAGIIESCRLSWPAAPRTALPHGVSRSGQTWRQSCRKLPTGQRGPQQRAIHRAIYIVLSAPLLPAISAAGGLFVF